MRLVVGLGNPGPNYVGTRHNVGFAVARELAERWTLTPQASGYRGDFAAGRARGHEAALLLPTTFMNASGESVLALLEEHEITLAEDLLVVYDDLDLPFGRLRLRAGGGCGGHRGMESIATELGSEDFARLRFGIGRPQNGQDVVEYVLAPFSDEEARLLPGHLERAADAVEAMMFGDRARAMEQVNRSDPGGEESASPRDEGASE